MIALIVQPARAGGAKLVQVRSDAKGDYTRFVAEFSEKVEYSPHDEQIANGYFYVDVRGADLRGVARDTTRIDDQRILTILVRPFPDAQVLRFVFNTDGVHPVAVSDIAGPFRLIVDVYDRGKRPDDYAPSSSDVPGRIVATSTIKAVPVARHYQPPRFASAGAKPFRVVIDPGHGGGSKGAAARTKLGGKQWLEKELTLAISNELKRLIDADPSMECVMTRTSDRDVSLEDRVAIAEKTRGDLFISVHLNSIAKDASSGSARGIEVYYLDDKGSGRLTSRIADAASGPKKITEAIRRQAAAKSARLVERSRGFAGLVEESWRSVGYFRAHSRGQKRANFWVLKNAYMPAVLVEVCFISNPDDLRFIVDRKNQVTTARAMYEAIRGYRDRYSGR